MKSLILFANILFSTQAFADDAVCLLHEIKGGVVNDSQNTFSKDRPLEFSTPDGFFSGRVQYQAIPGATGLSLTIKNGKTEASTFFDEPISKEHELLVILTVDERTGYLRCNL